MIGIRVDFGPHKVTGAFNDTSSDDVVNVAGDLLSIPGTKVFSWGPTVLVYQSTTNITLHCPKGAVAEAALWSMGRERSSDNFKNLLAFMRHKMKSYNVPAEILDSTVFAASALGFVRNVSFETSVLHGIVKPLLPVIQTHKDAMSMKFNAVWTWRKAVAAVIAGSVVVGGAVGTAAFISAAAAMYTGTAIFASTAALATGSFVRHYLSQPVPTATPSELAFPLYHATRSSNPARTLVQHLPAGLNLPATDPPKSVEHILSNLDPSAKITIVDDVTNREKPDRGPLKPAGIISTMSIPVVPSNSAHSSISAMGERILKKWTVWKEES